VNDLPVTRRRMAAFWERTDVDEPLIRTLHLPEIAQQPLLSRSIGRMLAEGEWVEPGSVDGRAMAQALLPIDDSAAPYVQSLGIYDSCWSQAAMGCRVRIHGGRPWAEPMSGDVDRIVAQSEASCAAWSQELLQAVEAAVATADGRCPIGGPLLRGPLDMAAALLGDTRLCLLVMDGTSELTALVAACGKVHALLNALRLAQTPDFDGGFVPYAKWGLWAPGACIRMQNDASALISAGHYRRFALTTDEVIASQAAYSIFHLHSAAIHILPALLENRYLSAVQVQLDPPPSGPSLDSLLPALATVRAAGKGLLICGPLTKDEVHLTCRALHPAGLAIQIELSLDT
jgi:hypothetical protein